MERDVLRNREEIFVLYKRKDTFSVVVDEK